MLKYFEAMLNSHVFLLFLFLIFIYLATPVRHSGSLVEGMHTLRWGMWGLIPWPGIEPEPPLGLGAPSLHHWTMRKIPFSLFKELKLEYDE